MKIVPKMQLILKGPSGTKLERSKIEIVPPTLMLVPKMQLNLKGPSGTKLSKIENENDLAAKTKNEVSSIEEQVAALHAMHAKATEKKKTDYEYCIHIYMHGSRKKIPIKLADIKSSLDPMPGSVMRLNMRNLYALFKSADDGRAVESYINSEEEGLFAAGKAFKVDPAEADFWQGWAIGFEVEPGTTKRQINDIFQGNVYRLGPFNQF